MNNIAKKKYYVVWSGRETGIFDTWNDCKAQVHGFVGARYKSYPSKEEAQHAFEHGAQSGNSKSKKKSKQKPPVFSGMEDANYIENSISVDAACSGNPGLMEYRGVYTKDGQEIFHYGPIDHGTNNIGEFLAIVHALALLKQKNSSLPIYSDSLIAIGWVRKKKMNTTIPKNKDTEKIWDLIERSQTWLRENTYDNEILKWKTDEWGEIKADFGRK